MSELLISEFESNFFIRVLDIGKESNHTSCEEIVLLLVPDKITAKTVIAG
jgi:hypothetical protein